MKQSKVLTVATWISHIFDPAIILFILTVLVVHQSNLSTGSILGLLAIIPLVLGVPIGYLLWKIKTHEIGNWEMTKRKERIKPFLVFMGSLFVDIILVSFFDNPLLLNFTILLFCWVFGFFCITLFWKISGHSGINMLGALLIVHWFGIVYWPVFIAVLLVSWARIARRVHTPAQVLAGIIYSSGIVFLGIRLLGI